MGMQSYVGKYLAVRVSLSIFAVTYIIHTLLNNTDMKDLKGTKTERNLMEAFAGESEARNKYTYFRSEERR